MYIGLVRGDKIHLVVFFSCLGGALLLLLGIYYCASKFMRGDFLPSSVDGEEEEEEEEDKYTKIDIYKQLNFVTYNRVAIPKGVEEMKNKNNSKNSDYNNSNNNNNNNNSNTNSHEPVCKKAHVGPDEQQVDPLPPPIQTTPKPAPLTRFNSSPFPMKSRTQSESSVCAFAAQSKLKIFLAHQPKLRRIMGCVRSIEWLSIFNQPPHIICFHVKLLPLGKPRTKTKWMALRGRSLDVDFVLGPLTGILDSESWVCVRMYGKQRRSGVPREKCYGECLVRVGELMNEGGEMEVDLTLEPKAGRKASSSSIFKRSASHSCSRHETDAKDMSP